MIEFVLADSGDAGSDVSLSDLRIRRCRGCVRCLTEHAGECEIDDGFTPLIDGILGSDRLVIVFGSEHGTVPDRVRKAVERLSNILDAYTGCGGNDPLPTDSVRLRTVEIVYKGDFDDRMESDIAGSLRKGPVGEIVFTYRRARERELSGF